jgi:D-glycero-D-manno-heptose 1,7-bisphosphate phosphatase
MKKRAVFLDRDGTLNKDVGYPNSYHVIEFFPYSFDAVRKIKEAGFLAIVVTNQSGIGRGLIAPENLEDIHTRMGQEFARHNAPFDAIYFCPHHIHSQNPAYRKKCTCRKPNPGMGYQAAADLDIDTSRSYMIGDKVEDILFGYNLQASPILVLTGYGRESFSKLEERGIRPAYVADTLLEAVDWIVHKEKNAETS